MICLRLALAVSLLAAPLAATAQTPAPAPAQAPAALPWQVDWGQYYCSMVRRPGEGRPFTTAILTVPGSLGTQIMLMPEGRAAVPARINRIVLMPGGRSFDMTARSEVRGTQTVRILSGLDYGFRDLLAEASELRLQRGDAVLTSIPLHGVRGAVAAHRRCTAETSRAWGVDEAALAALREQPASTNVLGFRPEDYPAGALAARTQGRVSLRIMVNADGGAGDCAVVVTSGSPEIDTRSCRVVMTRARFRPGLDAGGRPVSIATVFTITWMIPGQ